VSVPKSLSVTGRRRRPSIGSGPDPINLTSEYCAPCSCSDMNLRKEDEDGITDENVKVHMQGGCGYSLCWLDDQISHAALGAH